MRSILFVPEDGTKYPRKTAWFQGVPLHCLLFAVYPVIALLGTNRSEVEISSGIRPLLLSILMAGFLLLVFRGIYSDWRRAALASTLILILFYSYGHIYILLKGINVDGLYLFRHRTLIPLWFVLAAAAVWWAARKRLKVASATYALNLIGLFLLVLPIFQLISFSVRSSASQTTPQADASALNLKTDHRSPDIYYIILDGYGRADVLKDEYGYDNSDFLGTLREAGFVIGIVP